jgi:hypothetical protein
MAAVEHLKYQLSRLAESRCTLSRLIDLANERHETAWNELTPQDIGELDGWLRSQITATKGETHLRWGFVQGVFDTVREAGGLG